MVTASDIVRDGWSAAPGAIFWMFVVWGLGKAIFRGFWAQELRMRLDRRHARRLDAIRQAQRAGGFRVLRLPSKEGRIFDCLSAPDQPVWKDHLLHDRRTPPPDQVAFRIDWSEFLAEQSDRTRRAIGLLAAGYKRSEVADTLGVTRPAVTQRIDRVRRDWEKFRLSA